MNRSLRSLLLLTLGISTLYVAFLGVMWVNAQSSSTVLTPFERSIDRIQRATVLVYQAQETRDALQITCVGSGTLVSRRGLILTNAHHTVPNDVQ